MSNYNIKTYVVNLSIDVEKREYIEKHLNKLNIKHTVFDAVYGKNLDDREIENFVDQDKALKVIGRKLTKGEIGCALSHYRIASEVISNKDDAVIVLEDDVEILNELINVDKSFIPEHADIILLGYYINPYNDQQSFQSFWGREFKSKQFQLVRLSEMAYGTHAYLLTLKGARKIKKIFESKIYQPIDHYTGVENYLNMYACKERFARVSPEFIGLSNMQAERIVLSSRKYSRLRYSNGIFIKSFKKSARYAYNIVKACIPKLQYRD